MCRFDIDWMGENILERCGADALFSRFRSTTRVHGCRSFPPLNHTTGVHRHYPSLQRLPKANLGRSQRQFRADWHDNRQFSHLESYGSTSAASERNASDEVWVEYSDLTEGGGRAYSTRNFRPADSWRDVAEKAVSSLARRPRSSKWAKRAN